MNIIDISHWQTVTDWQALKNSVDGIICKATQGSAYVDPSFVSNVQKAHSVGLKVGAYHFVQWQDPIQEAANFLNATKGLTLDFVSFIDEETDPGSIDVEQWTKSFVSAVGLPMDYYSYTSFIQEHSMNFPLPLWIADYSGKEPSINHVMWQYSEHGHTPGVQGETDLDTVSYLDLISNYQTVDLLRTTTSDLNCRVAPGTWFDVRRVIPQGTQIRITKLYQGWAYTTYGQYGGWVSRQYLKQ
jgi:GH25 family lysozyme M1 (1,4-beta-N-acetylmuramidase)